VIRALLLAAAAVFLSGGGAVRAQETAVEPVCGPRPPPIPAFPEDPPDPPAPPAYAPGRGMGTTLELGVGAVALADDPLAAPPPTVEWLAEVEFPLFVEPGGALAGWVMNGWWVEVGAGPPRRLESGPMVETGYETASWIALEAGENGWVRLRLLDPGGAGDGTAWVLACHLAASDPPLAFTPWEEWLAGPGPIFFRTAAAHALRAGPRAADALLSWIRGNDHDAMLEPLEVRGEWMKVRVTRPSTYCVSDPSPAVRVDEGWIRWRDEEMGPWVWTFTRGC